MQPRLIAIFIAITSCFAAFAWQPADSVRVRFRLGSAAIDPGFSGNSMSIDDFCENMEELMKCGGGMQLRSVTVSGTVSPEGPKRLNDRLAVQRSEALAKLLATRFSIPDSIIKVVPAGADWSALADSVEADLGMPCRSEVVRILRCMAANSEDCNALYEIKKVGSDGAAYRRLVSRHFPPMRAAEAYITFNLMQIPDVSINLPHNPESENCATRPCPIPSVPAASDVERPNTSGWIPIVLKTNMLYDVAATPNIGMEIAVGKNWSVEANWMYAWWSRNASHRYWRVYGGDFGVRRWFGRTDRQVLTGHHVGVYGQMLTYDFEFGGKGRLGDKWTWGAGVSYGYSLPVCRCLNIDFTLGLGYAGGEYKKYHPEDNCYVWESTHRLNYVGPTKAEISLVWYLDGRIFRKGGVR